MQQPELALPASYVPAAAAPAHLPFDYGVLNTGTATQLRSCADTIRSFQNKVTEQVIAIGEILLAVKKALDHGQFGEWLVAEFGWSERTAQNYMRAAETFSDKCETVADLPPTTLYQLAAPSTPEPVRAAVLEASGNLAVKLARTFTAQVEALAKLRKPPEQRVVVEHVHVHPGAQAVVGNVNHSTPTGGGVTGCGLWKWRPHDALSGRCARVSMISQYDCAHMPFSRTVRLQNVGDGNECASSNVSGCHRGYRSPADLSFGRRDRCA